MSLKISPDELAFKFELRKQIPTTLNLMNPGTTPVAFKVKTTSPKSYAVRPNTGVVAPGGAVDIQITMQAQKETPNFNNVKDKFLVQSTALKSGEELTPEMFSKSSAREMKETKLLVVFQSPPPPSPVPEDSETQDNVSSSNKLSYDLEEALTKIQSLEAELAKGPGTNTAVKSTNGFNGFSLIHVILTAIICFLLGKYS